MPIKFKIPGDSSAKSLWRNCLFVTEEQNFIIFILQVEFLPDLFSS
jgi:hypothetical protein